MLSTKIPAHKFISIFTVLEVAAGAAVVVASCALLNEKVSSSSKVPAILLLLSNTNLVSVTMVLPKNKMATNRTAVEATNKYIIELSLVAAGAAVAVAFCANATATKRRPEEVAAIFLKMFIMTNDFC